MSDLFKDFDPVSAKEWKQKIQVDLKGKDYNSLVTNTPEKIDIRPFYHPDTDEKNQAAHAAQDWNICVKVRVKQNEETQKQVEKALNKGAESIWLILENENFELQDVLQNIDFGTAPLLLDFTHYAPATEQLKSIEKTVAEEKIQASLSFDPLGKLARTGNWFNGETKDFDKLHHLFSESESPVVISGEIYQNAGANAVQQVAYALSQAVEYLNYFKKKSPPPLEQIRFQFKMAQGSDYFMEIAKLRALRLLYAQIAQSFGAPEDIKILAFPTQRNKTVYDYNINLLRTTTESMSAILGGADEICNAPYDEIFHESNDFGERISRNQLLVLKHESYFNAVQNPAEGSYYIENLTGQIGKKALKIIKSIEKAGGFLAELKEGTLQRKIRESADAEQRRFNFGELILVGTNKYENPDDRMKGELEKTPFLERNKRKTLLPPIISRRLAEIKEQQRLEKEKKDKE